MIGVLFDLGKKGKKELPPTVAEHCYCFHTLSKLKSQRYVWIFVQKTFEPSTIYIELQHKPTRQISTTSFQPKLQRKRHESEILAYGTPFVPSDTVKESQLSDSNDRRKLSRVVESDGGHFGF